MTGGLRPPLADTQAEVPVCWCGRCKAEVYSGENRFRWETQWICVDCFNHAVTRLLREAPLEIAGELSVECELV